MTLLRYILFYGISLSCYADTIEHYMNIYNTIPQMSLKADANAQMWARSARNVLAITNETLAETLLESNATARAQGSALFCLPQGATLNSSTLEKIIVETYQNISSRNSDKNAMTVSQVALLGLKQQYPCTPTQAPRLAPQTPQALLHQEAQQ